MNFDTNDLRAAAEEVLHYFSRRRGPGGGAPPMMPTRSIREVAETILRDYPADDIEQNASTGKLYVDQHCRIHLALDRPGNEVRITFNEMNPNPVTLALSYEMADDVAQELIRATVRKEPA